MGGLAMDECYAAFIVDGGGRVLRTYGFGEIMRDKSSAHKLFASKNGFNSRQQFARRVRLDDVTARNP
jgi:hypothetical protein